MRVEGRVTRPLDLFLSDNLASVQQSIPDGLNRRLELAYTTFHTALATDDPEVKYILFVTAIEALIADQDKPKDVLAALKILKQYAEESGNFSADVLKRLKDISGEQRRIDQ